MTRPEFESLVHSAVRRLPHVFRNKLVNIAMVVED